MLKNMGMFLAIRFTGVSEIDTPIKAILGVFLGYICVLGVFKIINGVKTMSDAQEEMDQARRSQGMNTLFAGIIEAGAPAILLILGIAL